MILISLNYPPKQEYSIAFPLLLFNLSSPLLSSCPLNDMKGIERWYSAGSNFLHKLYYPCILLLFNFAFDQLRNMPHDQINRDQPAVNCLHLALSMLPQLYRDKNVCWGLVAYIFPFLFSSLRRSKAVNRVMSTNHTVEIKVSLKNHVFCVW